MIIFILLPWMFFLCLWRWFSLRGFGAREGLLAANVVGAGLTVFSIEILTVCHQLRFASLFLFWSCALAAIIGMLLRLPRVFHVILPSVAWTRTEKILLVFMAVIVFVTGSLALFVPPNTWDSMTYHMARVVHWELNQGVMNYPTHNIRQLVYFPFAEYLILNAYILTGSDRLASGVQWAAFWISACGVSLTAKVLGASRLGQILAALFVVTLPMAILQATSTQNDLVAGLWVVCSVYFTLQAVFQKRCDMMILAALSIAVAALTKGVGLVFGAALVISLLSFSELKWKQKGLFVGLIFLAVVLVCAPFYGRLSQIASTPAKAMAMGGDVAVERWGAAELVSGGVKNVAMEVALPFHGWNKWVDAGVGLIHQWVGVPIKDPQLATSQDLSIVYSVDEDTAPSPLHMFLILFVGAAFFFVRKKSRQQWFCWMTGTLGAAFFCMTVKWRPWITRFHVPFFLVAAPLVVVVLERCWNRRALIIVFGILFLGSWHALTGNNTRAIFSGKSVFSYTHEQLYFARWRGADRLYRLALNNIQSAACSQVGLIMGADSWEYPFWALSDGKMRFEHINVTTKSAAFDYPRGAFMPCAVIKETAQEETVITYNRQPFFRVLKGFWTVYIRFDHMPSEFQAEVVRRFKGK